MSDYEQVILLTLLSYIGLAGATNYVLASGNLPLCAGYWFGTGAYTTGLIVKLTDVKMPVEALLIAVVGCTLSNALIFLPIKKLKGNLYAFYSLSIQLLFSQIIISWWKVTGGENGLSGISRLPLWLLICFGFIFIFLFLYIELSGYLKYIKAVGDDELAAIAAGIDVYRIRYFLNVIAGAIGALAGGIAVLTRGYVDPSCCSLTISIMVLVGVCIGGSGGLLGILIASMFLTVVPESIRIVRTEYNMMPELQNIVLGAVLIIVVWLGPKTILPSETRTYDR